MRNLFLTFNKGHSLPHIEQKFPQGYDLTKKNSSPEHPKNRSGVCLVVGAHPCLFNDIDEAKALYPDAAICALNDVASLIPADFLATCHPEKLDQFLTNQPDIEIHSRTKMKRPVVRDNEYMWDLNTGGGSCLFAVGVMLAIGFDKVVICGCPMDGGGGYAVKKHESTINDPRFGDLSSAHTLVQGWHGHLNRFKADNALAHKVRSMSGTTKKIFGGIDE